MTEAMTLERLLDSIRAGWADWQAALERVDRERIQQPGVVADWSVKDLVAHVTWFEVDMLLLLRERSMAQSSPLWSLPPDERNRAIYEENRARSIEDVLDENSRVHTGMVAEIEKLSERDLRDPSGFDGMPTEWLPWQILCENTYDHYSDHTQQINDWLKAHP